MLSLKILGEYMICLKIIILRKHVFQLIVSLCSLEVKRYCCVIGESTLKINVFDILKLVCFQM